MRTRMLILLAIVAATPLASSRQGADKGPLSCPVTRLSIPSTKAAVAKETYKGKTYYFCTMNCKKLFDKNRAKYGK